MGGGRRRGAKGLRSTSELSVGDLVLAKVKGFPAWPAKISEPEVWGKIPDPKKYFVYFFGTEEIAFVAPADVQVFTVEVKNKLSARCKGKPLRFTQAVKDICEEFEKLQQKNLNGSGDDNSRDLLGSEDCSIDADEDDDAMEVDMKDDNSMNKPYKKKGTQILGGSISPLERCSQRPGIMDGEERKPCTSGNFNSSASPSIYGTQGTSKTDGPISLKKEVVSTKFMKGKNDDIRVNAENEFKDLNKAELFRKKMNAHQGQLKQASRSNEVSHAIKRDVTVASAKTSTQTNKKVESNGLKDVKRSLLKGNIENHSTVGAPEFVVEDEDALHPSKRPCRTVDITEERVRKNNAAFKSESSSVDNVKSSFPVTTKRRAVRLCDNEEEEAPKTPIHAGSVNKASHLVDTAKKNDAIRGSTTALQVTKKRLRVEDGSTKDLSSAERSVEDASRSSQKHVEKKLRKTVGKSDSASPKRLIPEKASGKDPKTALSSTKMSPASVATSRPIPGIENPRKGDTANPPDCNIQKRPPTSQDIVSGVRESSSTSLTKQIGEKSKQDSISEKKNATTSKISSYATDAVSASGGVSGNGSVGERPSTSLNKQMGEKSKLDSISERKKATSKTSSLGIEAVLASEGVSGNGSVQGERLEVSRAERVNSLDDSRISDRDTSMRHLIAAAQEKRRQAHLQSLNSNVFFAMSTHAEAAKSSPSSVSPIPPLGSSSMLRPDALLQAQSGSPSSDLQRPSNSCDPETENKKIESGNGVTESSLSGGTEAAVARDAFEGMIETLSRTKESIGRATRLAIDCAKYGIANEVIELLIRKLQSENSMHRKVDLFFLVDSITQCSHNHKGIAGTSYIPIVQAALSRLLGAVAPPGAAARDNRRQCLKVLKLWQERKILPEAFLQPFMDEVGVANDETSSGLSVRRPSRIQRAFDDPIREMEGMFVDEYGSNATFQLAGFFSSRAFDDNDDDDDDDDEITVPTNVYKEVSERSPGEHTPVSVDAENQIVTPSERRHCILEDVDGELEMEDVSVSLKDGMEYVSAPLEDERHLNKCASTEVAVSDICLEMFSNNSELPLMPEGSPPLPLDSPPQTPPLPSSPPPVLPQLPPTVPPPSPSPSQANPFLLRPEGPRSGLPLQPLQPQHSLVPQCLQLPSSISSSPSVYQHQPSTNKISLPSSGNQITQIVATAPHGLHGDLPVRNDLYGQFPCFVTLEAGNPQEHSRCNTSRPIEYSQIDAYGNPQSSQPGQQFQPTFTQTPVHPDAPTQNQLHHLAYPHPQHPYVQSFSLPNLPSAPRLYVADDQWRARPAEFNNDYRSNSWMAGGRSSTGAAPFSQEGFPIPHPERPPTSTFSFQSPRPSTLPTGPSVSGHVMSSQVDKHAHNWRPS